MVVDGGWWVVMGGGCYLDPAAGHQSRSPFMLNNETDETASSDFIGCKSVSSWRRHY